MAKKAAKNSDRTDPKQNKSLAVRNVIKKLPTAKFADVAKAVKEEYGHDVKSALFYPILFTKPNLILGLLPLNGGAERHGGWGAKAPFPPGSCCVSGVG